MLAVSAHSRCSVTKKLHLYCPSAGYQEKLTSCDDIFVALKLPLKWFTTVETLFDKNDDF